VAREMRLVFLLEWVLTTEKLRMGCFILSIDAENYVNGMKEIRRFGGPFC
jgi:hypothetical protein